MVNVNVFGMGVYDTSYALCFSNVDLRNVMMIDIVKRCGADTQVFNKKKSSIFLPHYSGAAQGLPLPLCTSPFTSSSHFSLSLRLVICWLVVVATMSFRIVV